MSTGRRSRPGPVSGRTRVAAGDADLLRDDDASDGWLLTVDGVAQSYLDLADPTHLEFDYVRLLGDVVDCLAGEGAITAVHLGAGACTLPRYVAATRPGSSQLVVEIDPALADLVRDSFGTAGFRLRVGDARAELTAMRAGESDLVIADVFAGASVPLHTTTLEFLSEVRRVLRTGGTYAANVADGRPLPFARAQVATLLAAFEHVALLADPSVLRGRRFANLVLVASDAPLPIEALTRRAARAAGRARLVDGAALRAFTGGAAAVTDATAVAGPRPPADLFRR